MSDEPDHQQNDVDVAAMREIRDRLIEISIDHERAMHDGNQCLNFRFGAIAYIAHSLGLSTAHAIPIISTIALYDHRHHAPARIHPHPEI